MRNARAKAIHVLQSDELVCKNVPSWHCEVVCVALERTASEKIS